MWEVHQDRKHNKANEIWNSTPDDAITEGTGQVAWADPARDAPDGDNGGDGGLRAHNRY
jgi:hypothetical protein